MNVLDNSLQKAFQWLGLENGKEFLLPEEHCPTRDVFQTRLDHMLKAMEKYSISSNDSPLLAAITGEIGNNSFDHNVGSWKDEIGIYFTYYLSEKFILIADRGQGVLTTLKRVRPELKTEAEAIRIAFTEKISGRSPERRGNGLKFTQRIIQDKNWKLYFYSGNGMFIINKDILEVKGKQNIKGVLAVLQF
ncbi:MAG: hypothetical protein HYT97_07670 [Elusimicrobia bacterium]|nr:hypothetical protein [Elusimicrobiota bacterium]